MVPGLPCFCCRSSCQLQQDYAFTNIGRPLLMRALQSTAALLSYERARNSETKMRAILKDGCCTNSVRGAPRYRQGQFNLLIYKSCQAQLSCKEYRACISAWIESSYWKSNVAQHCSTLSSRRQYLKQPFLSNSGPITASGCFSFSCRYVLAPRAREMTASDLPWSSKERHPFSDAGCIAVGSADYKAFWPEPYEEQTLYLCFITQHDSTALGCR